MTHGKLPQVREGRGFCSGAMQGGDLGGRDAQSSRTLLASPMFLPKAPRCSVSLHPPPLASPREFRFIGLKAKLPTPPLPRTHSAAEAAVRWHPSHIIRELPTQRADAQVYCGCHAPALRPPVLCWTCHGPAHAGCGSVPRRLLWPRPSTHGGGEAAGAVLQKR